MNLRQESREYTLKFLFQCDFNEADQDEVWDDFWRGKRAGRRVREFARELAEGVLVELMDIDSEIQMYSENWQLNRMAAIDRNAMRIAVYEMMFRNDIPPVVSINEAVRLAKEYGTPDSGSFVNGILDKVMNNLDRPKRSVNSDKE